MQDKVDWHRTLGAYYVVLKSKIKWPSGQKRVDKAAGQTKRQYEVECGAEIVAVV